MKSPVKKLLSLCCLTIALVSCSKSENPMPKSSGFLPHYTLLKQIGSPKGTQLYVYKNPEVKREDYHAVIVQPVILYQTATANGVKKKEIAAAQADLNRDIEGIVSKSIDVTTVPGPGVASLSTAITGATVTEAGFSPMNIIPISAAIKLASMATDLDSKTPVLVIEMKLIDSVTGKSLLESLAVMSGETFRKRINTPQEFEQLAKVWIEKDLQLSLNQR